MEEDKVETNIVEKSNLNINKTHSLKDLCMEMVLLFSGFVALGLFVDNILSTFPLLMVIAAILSFFLIMVKIYKQNIKF